jgi:hypothetical protein
MDGKCYKIIKKVREKGFVQVSAKSQKSATLGEGNQKARNKNDSSQCDRISFD